MKSELFLPVTFTATRADGAGTKTVTATTVEQKIKLADCFGIFDLKTAEGARGYAAYLIDHEPYVLTLESKDNDRESSGYFRRTVKLGLEWSEPYLWEFCRRTGSQRRALPNIELTAFHPWGCLCPTHDTIRVWIEDGHFCADIIVHTRDWNGKTAAEYADSYALSVLKPQIGETVPCPQYIESGGWGAGALKPNPKWGRSPEYRPALGCPEFFGAIIEQWLLAEASDQQREIVRQSDEIHRQNLRVHDRFMSDLHRVRYNFSGSGITYDWNKPTVTWEAFKALQNQTANA